VWRTKRIKGRRLGEKAFTRRAPIEGGPGGSRKGTYGALGSCLGSGSVLEGGEDSESLGLARGGRALVRRLGSLGRSGIAVDDAWRV
jgi:hypothetical protein